MRARDLELLHLEKLLTGAHRGLPNGSPQEPSAEGSTGDGVQAETTASAEGEEQPDITRKQKRNKEKETKRRQALLAATESLSDKKSYDETLLAVIGVLDEVKLQRNVAAWVRAGGMWGPNTKAIDAVSETDTSAEQPQEKLDSSPPAGNDALSSTDPQETAKDREDSPSDTSAPVMWFEHSPTVQFWAERGRKALEELRIRADHGIER